MKKVLLIICLIIVSNCDQKKKSIQGQTVWQIEMNSNFKDATISPLKDKDRKYFDGLDFFDFDSSYVVNAHLNRTPDSKFFNMRTTTSRVSQERIYGVLSFEMNGRPFQLNVYQGKEALETKGNEDYLFLPFLDNTNGDMTYGGGRYIDLRIPKGDSLTIDFNKAFNPLCAYNDKYSCPIVPRDNYLDTEVKAGVKAYDKH